MFSAFKLRSLHAADSFSLYLGDAARVSKLALGAGVQSMRQLALNSDFPIAGCSVIDDVSISVVPGPWESKAGGLALLVAPTRHREPV